MVENKDKQKMQGDISYAVSGPADMDRIMQIESDSFGEDAYDRTICRIPTYIREALPGRRSAGKVRGTLLRPCAATGRNWFIAVDPKARGKELLPQH